MVSAMATVRKHTTHCEDMLKRGVILTNVGLAIASHHIGGTHVCIVLDERSRSKYAASMGEARMSSESQRR